MHLLGYIVLYPIFWFLSVLPFRVLYFLSDIVYIIIYKIVGYRKSTVRENMRLALPHLSFAERKTIEKKFYHHFCDSFFEMIKMLSLSEEEMGRRFTLNNMELVHEYEAKGKSVALICAHYGSYEWLLVMNKHLSTHKGFGIYKTIRNKYFDDLVKKIRNRFDAELIDTRRIIPAMRDHKRNGILGYYGFLSDQSPKLQSAIHWTKVFGMEVPVHVGAEMLAKKMDLNIMFVKGGKIKRGYYNATFIGLEKPPKEYPNYEITDQFIALMEQQIIEAPEYYLWTHKRFKHRRNDPPVVPTV